jgi:hypothetical protein
MLRIRPKHQGRSNRRLDPGVVIVHGARNLTAFSTLSGGRARFTGCASIAIACLDFDLIAGLTILSFKATALFMMRCKPMASHTSMRSFLAAMNGHTGRNMLPARYDLSDRNDGTIKLSPTTYMRSVRCLAKTGSGELRHVDAELVVFAVLHQFLPRNFATKPSSHSTQHGA